MDTLSDTEKISYLFRVDAPFEDSPDTAAFYFATFNFDTNGNFVDVNADISILLLC